MARVRKILSPVDFSETAATAVREAEALARAVDAELLLVHVLDQPAFAYAEGQSYATPSLAEEYEREMRRRLKMFADAIGQHGLRVRPEVVRGRPHEAIVAAADAEQADLIVMGTHGRAGVRHFLLGSVAERVVRTARVPVMTVRAP